MKYLSLEEILRLHFTLIEDFGGLHGVRSEVRLLSVVETPRQELFGEEQYPTIYAKAAVYLRNIIGDHPFSDGNKRTGVLVAGVFLLRNDVRLTATPRELEDFAVAVATEHLEVGVIATWLATHS
ncbi:MAG TPA: type II toxin-antitoxin system death-on-curing family toxin [Candidatus Saccharimonadaceae bacterium]|nr:type II toxin-antitoxin system death-on-curing family toxin [Candidatus Saccharimonadaceae bacterium]